MQKNEIKGIITSTLFVVGEAVEAELFVNITGESADEIDIIIQEMIIEGNGREDGILIKRLGNKVQLCTNPKYAGYIKEMYTPEVRASLSVSAIETLSIIAYRQPVTRTEIENIRGIKSNYAVSILVEKGLVREAGRKDVLGKPLLFETTDEFLRQFGLESLKELPALEDLEENEDLEKNEE